MQKSGSQLFHRIPNNFASGNSNAGSFAGGSNTNRQLESIEIRPLAANQEIFRKLITLWKDNEIPECHQKYYYNILLSHERDADKYIQNEIESLEKNQSVVKLLHQLTVGRERCIKEIQRAKMIHIMDFVRQISKFIYDLRKLTMNLIEYHRKWKTRLQQYYEYSYVWIINRIDYFLKIREDCKFILQAHPKMAGFFDLVSEGDIFYINVVNQAKQVYDSKNEDYYDYLKPHNMAQHYIDKMNKLKIYYEECVKDKPQVQLIPNMASGYQSQSSPKFPSRHAAPTALPDYKSTMLDAYDDIQFIQEWFPLKDLDNIASYWHSQSVIELSESFHYPIQHLTDLLMYWQEAVAIRINESGWMICSVDQEFSGRRWIIHMLLLHKDAKWEQRLGTIIQSFIKMLIKMGDPFTSLSISCSNDKTIKSLLQSLKFTFVKSMTYQHTNVFLYEQKIQNTVPQTQRKYFTALTLRMVRIYAEQAKSTLITDEELMIAQMCANLGKNNLMRFEDNITAIAPILSKSKLYGQEFMLIHNQDDIRNKYLIDFQSPVKGPVYLQQFNIRLNFKLFTSEVHRNSQLPYIRLMAVLYVLNQHPSMNDNEASILELTSNENAKRKLYLISTIDPTIKIYIYETSKDEVTSANVQQIINTAFEKFDKKSEGTQNIWLPQFKCTGQQLTLPYCVMNAFFQNDTHVAVNYPRLPGLHSVSYTHDLDKVIQQPFLIGIVQSDMEQINKPIFSLLIQQEHLITGVEKKIHDIREVQPFTMQQRDIDTKINELLKPTAFEIQKSFTSDPSALAYKLRYGLEATVLNINNGHVLIYVDENHINEKRWVIETIFTNSLNNLQNLLMTTVNFIFQVDTAASEVQISQIHYLEQGDLIANKQVMDFIKKAGFKWRLVDNDAKTQTRKTVYVVKRPIDKYPQKIPNQQSIQFKCYYAIQQSEQRNQIVNKLEYLQTKDIFQFYEDCFQHHVNGDDRNPFLKEKFNLHQLPATEFKVVHGNEELKKLVKQIPEMGNQFQRFNVLFTNTQLKLRKQRSVTLERRNYIEIPNMESQQIFQSDLFQLNARIVYVPTQDPFYFFYFVELREEQVQKVKSDFLDVTTQVTQAFLLKQSHLCNYLLIPQFSQSTQIHQQQNVLQAELALRSERTFECTLLEDKGVEIPKQWIVRLPMMCGVLHTQVRTQFERPLIAWIICDYE